MQRVSLLLLSSRHLRGTVVAWHAFERHGVIRCSEEGREYRIPNARAFETILPTNLHLEGAKVEFDVLHDAQEVDRVITRSHVAPITEKSYAQRNPVDFLSAFRLDLQQNPKTQADLGMGVDSSTPTLESPPALFAGRIIVDMSTLSATGEKANTGTIALGTEEGMPPPLGVKDLRNACVLDADTKELLRLRHELGDMTKAREALRLRREDNMALKVQQRQVLATAVTGVVLAWSHLYRSGVVLENSTPIPEPSSSAVPSSAVGAVTSGNTNNNAQGMEGLCIIRNVDAFDTALPTSLDLVGRVVTFSKVSYSYSPSKIFAEGITVCGEIHFDGTLTAVEEAKAKKVADSAREKRAKQLGTHFNDEEYDYDTEPLPTGPLYGVVTRWSGGQGVIETGNKRLYYIQSAADFVQLVDHTSHTTRGAVVTFMVNSENRRNAKEVNILSLAVRNLVTDMPMLERKREARATAAAAAGGGGEDIMDTAAQELSADAEWMHGMMVTWSPLEGQGVIEGDDGKRYILHDAEEHVVKYRTHQSLLKKGRRLKFTSFGRQGRLACNVVLLDTEADDEAVAEAQLQQREPRISDGHVEEAIASPMSTAYWIHRMDRVGYDTNEVKQMQNKAISFSDDDDDDKLLDSEDLFKKDHWFNDPRKNMRLPNSDVTAGNLALIGPASMMNIAMKAHDPKKLEKMKDKYYNRLTEPMKEFAWKQAKELAPKYEKRIKEAREKGEEPRFSFY